MVYSNLLVLVLNNNSYQKYLHHYISFDKLKTTASNEPYIHLIRDDIKMKDDKIMLAKNEIDEIFENNKPMSITNYEFKKGESQIYEIPYIMLENTILLSNHPMRNIDINMKQRLNKKQEQVIRRINKIHTWKNEVIYKEKDKYTRNEKSIYLGDLIYKYIKQNTILFLYFHQI